MPDYQNAPYEMRGAREAMNAGLVQIEQHIKVIELSIAENPGLVFDLARAMIESTCLSVLKERGIEYSKRGNLPRLFKETTGNLTLLPPTLVDEIEAKNSLQKTLRGLSETVLGICELRNRYGFASHGSETERPALDEAHARLAAEAADTVIGFLHRVHRQERFAEALKFEDLEDFNEYLDEAIGAIRIFDAEFRASAVLFALERDSYLNYLAEYESRFDSAESKIEQNDIQI